MLYSSGLRGDGNGRAARIAQSGRLRNVPYPMFVQAAHQGDGTFMQASVRESRGGQGRGPAVSTGRHGFAAAYLRYAEVGMWGGYSVWERQATVGPAATAGEPSSGGKVIVTPGKLIASPLTLRSPEVESNTNSAATHGAPCCRLVRSWASTTHTQ